MRVLDWDSSGCVRRLDEAAETRITISGTEPHWHLFLSGRIPATVCVLTGRLRLIGDMRVILPYSVKINRLAQVAMQVGPPQ